MKTIFSFLFLLFVSVASAQKTEVTWDEESHFATVNGMDAFKIERFDCGFGAVDCHYDVWDLSGNKVMRINLRDYNSVTQISKSNPQGRVVYYEVIFLPTREICEVDFSGIKTEKVARMIGKAQLFQDGALNLRAAEEFVLVHGRPHSAVIKF